ncbi:nuclear pore complex [Aspergillus oryzae 100-8]|nr:nuclear pore complex [Aspergillus oryzae 100-8]
MSFGFGGFGQNNQSSGFGAGSGFGGTSSGGGFGSTTSPFGGGNTSGGGLFGNTSSSFGSGGGFGTGAQNQSNSLFGSQNRTGGFGTGTSATGGSLFGGNAGGTTATTTTTGGGFGGFGSTGNTGGFGSSNNTTGGGLFGNKTATATGTGTGFGSSTGATGGFGTSGGGFGTSGTTGFGSGSGTAFQQAVPPSDGTGSTPFSAFTEKDGNTSVTNHYQSISFMQPYNKYSFEELRLGDYQQGRRFGNGSGQAGAFGTSAFGGSGFGQQQQSTGFGSTSSPFGGTSAPAFGQTQTQTTGGFGSTPSNPLFGSNKPATSLFGGGATSTGTSQPSLFGGATATSGGFGSTANTGTGFGAGGSGGLFGNNNNNQQQQQNKSLFGGGGTSTGTGFGGFGQQNTSTSTPFGGTAATSSPFGGGQQQQQTGGSQQSSTPSLFGGGGATTGGSSLFGQNNQQPSTGGSLFGGPWSIGDAACFIYQAKTTHPIAVYKITPSAANRLVTPPKRQGYGFSYSTYGSPSSSTGTPSGLGNSLLGGSLRGSVNGGLGRASFSKSFSTSNLRKTFDPETDSILSPGALSSGSSRLSSGNLKRLTIDRSLRNDLFSRPASTPAAAITNGEDSAQPTDKAKKKVSFESTSDTTTGGEIVPVQSQTSEPTPEELGFLRSIRKSNTVNGLNGIKENGTRPEMESVRDKDLPAVPEGSEQTTVTDGQSRLAFVPSGDPQPGEYWMKPSRAELNKMGRDQLKHVVGFTVGRQHCGQVTFDEPVDLTNVDLDQIFGGLVDIGVRKITVYPDEAIKPPRGKGLNVPSILRIENSWPRGRDKKSPSPLTSGPLFEKHVDRLRKVHNTDFIDYETETGTWVFKVPHYTTYGLDYDSDDDDEGESLNQSTLSAAPDTPTPKAHTPTNLDNTVASEQMQRPPQ